ncbi:YihY/virulence factor BrkB family protein [uncultured Thiohalocapsa sp.]|mgnify:CR=1 FL=1|uniref:YihY/virulence factor BrkB family protein n=1 Tax=uncultured Thiohalocapsa sp. TaxID=768990 RepID=UPI0025DE9D6B|nr:YihY/virulence factor BrkB family protein [uncultured Thiohalocapsa sp.]
MTALRQAANDGVAGVWRHLLWDDPADLSPWQLHLRLPLRMAHAIGRDLAAGRLTLQAMSLVYTTLLSLVPLLAVSFSVLKGFGVHNQLEPMLLQALHPLGAGAQEVATRLIDYVDNTNVRVLGAVGLAVLLWSVLSLISKIEQVFNMTWRVAEQRPLAERFSRYLSVLLVGPVLLFSAVAASASVRRNALVQQIADIEVLGWLLQIAESLLPYALITLAFTFVYNFVPNTRVRLVPSVIGALLGGVLWLMAGNLFAQFMAGSTRYAAIYSSLAILILFMIWLYIAWLIVLVGANIAFYLQYPEYLASRDRDLRLSNRLRERLALLLLAAIVRRHYASDEAADAETLSHGLGMPLTNVRKLLHMLADGGYLVATATSPPRYVPAQAPEQVAVRRVLRYVRRFGEEPGVRLDLPPGTAVAGVEDRLQRAIDEALGEMTLKDLAAAQEVGV